MDTLALEEAALHLSLRERAQLAQKLLDSVDQPSEHEVQQRWLLEACRRADEIDRNVVELVSSEQLEAQVQTLLE